MIDYGYGVAFGTINKDFDYILRLWRNQKDVYQNCRQVGLIDEAHHEKWLQTIADSQSISMLSVMVKKNEEYVVVGVAGLTGISHTHGTAEISLYCDKETVESLNMTKRIAPKIIKTLACYAFLDLRLNRIFGDTFATNHVELANLDECGFVREGTLRQSYWKNGRFIDSVIHSMLRKEFEERRKEWDS